ncbi:MAG: hypothetical protein PUC65_17325 [Clostridiales bacterium]|nr:hypothetical protein [Clostridiales bacterium]
MIEDDTIKLLKECNAGVKMAVTSIDEVFDAVKDDKLRDLLSKSKQEHEALGDETHNLLNEYHDAEKDPNPIAKAMSWMKINMKLMTNGSDQEVSDLITDGCNMGTKSLHKYLNKYKDANDKAKEITRKLIDIEETLIKDLRCYL